MARINGLPGTGKTSVCAELQTRGYRAIDADRVIGAEPSGGMRCYFSK